jgi:DNA-binding winged helix-turn-helix (wHTH) protein
MESRSSPRERRRGAEIVVFGPDGAPVSSVALSHGHVTVGRLPDVNDIALQPDPQLLVTRAAHCTLERAGARWFVVDGGSVNGTFLRRGATFQRVLERTALQDGDVICVLASISESDERRFFELAFHAAGDPQATRAVRVPEAISPSAQAPDCLSYETHEARLVLVQGDQRHEIHIRAQAHRLVRYMVERNEASGGSPALCTHDELMHAVWEDEPMHTRVELARLVWELRKKLEPFGATHLIENERRRGYRMRSCPTRRPPPNEQ